MVHEGVPELCGEPSHVGWLAADGISDWAAFGSTVEVGAEVV